MKPLSKFIQEGLNQSNKTLLEIIVGDSDKEGLGIAKEVVAEKITADDVIVEEIVAEEVVTEKEKPSE